MRKGILAKQLLQSTVSLKRSNALIDLNSPPGFDIGDGTSLESISPQSQRKRIIFPFAIEKRYVYVENA
jgi:hypothetical protein